MLLKAAADLIERLLAGDFTEDEFQNLCHNIPPKRLCDFADGCDSYQRQLFGGWCRTDLLHKQLGIRGEALQVIRTAEGNIDPTSQWMQKWAAWGMNPDVFDKPERTSPKQGDQ